MRLDLVEKVYFAEIDRKSKIQAALAFPIGSSAFGVAAAHYAISNLEIASRCDLIVLLPILPATLAFVTFIVLLPKFLAPGKYQYLYEMEDLLAHRDELKRHHEKYPEAEDPEITLDRHIEADLAKCATANSALNDKRSEALYHINQAVFVQVLFSILAAAIVLFDIKTA